MFDTWQICGFPSITLEGTLDDWCLLQSKLANFGKLGLGWWAKKLKPLMHEFVSSIRGNPDRGFWEKMVYKDPPFQCNASEVVNGWISILFPYGARYGDCPQRQKLDGSDNLDIIDYPLGLGSVSMASKNASKVHLYAGFLGVEQREDFSLRPMTGWAVRRQSSFECILDDVERHERCRWTPAKRGPKANILSRRRTIRDSLGSTVEEVIKNILIESKQLQAFYSRFEDLEVCSKDGALMFRVRKSGEALRVSDPGNTEKVSQLHRIVDLADGRIIGLKNCSECVEGTRQQHSAFFLTDINNAIEASACPLIATSFEHVLRLLLDLENTTIELSQFYQPIGCLSPNDHEAVLRLITT